MIKKTIDDIIIPKKSIRQIPILGEKKGHHLKDESADFYDHHNNHHAPKVKSSFNWQRKPLNPKFAIWLIAGICLLSLFFGISIIFSSATIVITPKIEKITFDNDSYIAKLDSKDSTVISFEVLNVKLEAGENIEVTEEKEVSQKASGKIVIYNNYSTASQRLINNTRFESSNGKVYRINSSVIVPGLKKVDGKVVPGSIEAVVYADQPGESYNLKLADLTGDFKIPGFKGDPRYESFYARLKTDIIGGFVGKQRIVSDELRTKTEEIIKTSLKEQLLKKLYAIKPESFIILKDGYTVDYTSLPDTIISSDRIKVNVEGDLNGIVFNNQKLSNFIASGKIEGFDGLETEFIPSDNLITTFTAKENTSLWKNETLKLVLNGGATIKWLYDSEALKKDFAGKNESDLKNMIIKYKDSLASMKIIFTPVWTRYVPDELNKIKINEEMPPLD